MVDHGDVNQKDFTKARTTVSADIGKIGYVNRRQDELGVKLEGANVTYFSMSGHHAFEAAGFPIDLCGQLDISHVIGATRIANQSFSDTNVIGLQACAGVGLGPVGHLGYTYLVGVTQQNDKGYLVEQSHEIALRKIAGTPLSVSARAEESHTDVFSGQANSARDYSAKFVGVGGEF